MFRVYGYIEGDIKYLGSTFNEGTVIRILQNNLNPEYVHFMVLKQLQDRAEPYKTILSEKEFIEYAKEYTERVNDERCVELKRKILERVKNYE